jgi:hypothetical protein
MRRAEISLPELGLIAGTRGMLGAGLGLLVGDRLSEKPVSELDLAMVATPKKGIALRATKEQSAFPAN